MGVTSPPFPREVPQTTRRALVWWLPPVGMVLLYVALFFATVSETPGDGPYYVRDLLLYERTGDPRVLWEFGHLLWRPSGWLLYRGVTRWFYPGEAHLAGFAAFQGLSLLAGAVSILAVWALARRYVTGWRLYLAVLPAVLCYGFLDYVHTAAPYVTGLACLAAAWWLADRAVWWGAALLLASALLIWFPYVLAVPGVVFAAVWLARERLAGRRGLFLLIAAGAIVALAYVFAAVSVLHLTSLTEIRSWATAAGHGWSQNRQVRRMLFGVPRSFLYFGDDGVAFKQYLFHDPYNPVTLGMLVRMSLWKIAAFYGLLAGLCGILAFSREGRRMLLVIAVAALPTIWFAIFLFESGAPERYLCLLPFMTVALAMAVRRHVWVAVAFALLAVPNLYYLSRPHLRERYAEASRAVAALQTRSHSRDLVALPTLRERTYQFVLSFPFDSLNRRQRLNIYDVIAPGTDRVLTWRQDFARNSLWTWRRNGRVWLSRRLLDEKPDRERLWVEADDPKVAWKDLPVFFREFAPGESVGEFVELARTPENEASLQRWSVGAAAQSPTEPLWPGAQ